MEVSKKIDLSSFLTCDPNTLSESNPAVLYNLVQGQWKAAEHYTVIPDPLTGEGFIKAPDTKTPCELAEFKESSEKCPKTGLHNPIKSPERYLLYGSVCAKASALLSEKPVEDYFTRLLQRVFPKSDPQARGEVVVVRRFIENFAGDSIRFLCRSFNVAGDHPGQHSTGYRFPYGPVCVIAPFNFPLEIPALQALAALFTGNKVLVKVDSKVSIVFEEFLRLLGYCGLPLSDIDLIHADGPNMEALIKMTHFRLVQFTGSSRVAEKLAELLKGRIRIEDAGFDWKILGPDVQEFDYVSYVCDQDAYAISGQKCSAQSFLVAHDNWIQSGVIARLTELASRRSFKEQTISPVMTWTSERILEHQTECLKIPGSYLCFGGKPIEGTSVPKIYGLYEPTAVFVPLEQIQKHFDLVTREVFGPFQVITSYKEEDLEEVLKILERMENHLTAAVVSNDPLFLNKVLGNTINGTTYCGIRARTTGAPQNHWFGPAGDPRGAGIGSPESILAVWTCHREIITDVGPVNKGWKVPNAS